MNAVCAAPGCFKRAVHNHHCVYRQHIPQGVDVNDPRNLLPLCLSHHLNHHSRSDVLPVFALPDSALEFAAEALGDGPAYEYIRRRYRGPDARLEALAS